MDAMTLIEAVNSEKANHWKNSDLSSEVQLLLEGIAAHYATCEECRDAFDDMGYEEETLKDMELIFMNNNDLNLWNCEEEI